MLCHWTPLCADDYSYAYSWLDGTKIESIKDVFYSQAAHYKIMNGRFVTHTLAQLFLLLGKSRFNILNTISFLLLGLLIYYHGAGTIKKMKTHLLLLIFCLLFLETPAFGQSFLWLTGAANYLYGILIILSFLAVYRKKLYNVEIENEKEVALPSRILIFFKILLMLLFGFIAGATNENTSVALNVIVLLYILYFYIKKYKTDLWMFSGLLGCIVGCLCMLCSPGQRLRLTNSGGFDLNILILIKKVILISWDFLDSFKICLLILGMLFAVYMFFVKEESDSIKSLRSKLCSNLSVEIIYLVGMLASVYSMIVVPQFPKRVWSGPLVFLLIIVISVCAKAETYKNRLFIKVSRTVIMLLCLISIATYGIAFYNLKNIYYENAMRESLIEEVKRNDLGTVYVPAIKSNSKYSCFTYAGDLNYSSEEWPNTAIARYYGMDTVIREDDVRFSR